MHRSSPVASGHCWIDDATGRVSWPPPAPGGDPARRLYFLHVPKTGGIALGGFLRSMYSADEICPAYYPDDLLALDEAALAQYRYFAGHLWLHPLSIRPEPPAVVTVLRDPASHLRSFYEHGRRMYTSTRSDLWCEPFTDWLRDDATKPLNANIQARYLAGAVNDDARYDDDELFERALVTLDGCLWHSATEDLGATLPSLAAALRWPPPPRLRSANVGSHEPRSPSATERELAQLRCPVDARLHRYVRSRTRRRHTPGGQPFLRALKRASSRLDRRLVVALDQRFWGSGWLPPESFWLGDQSSSAPLGDRSTQWLAAGEPAFIDLPLRVRPGDRIDVYVAHALPTSVPALHAEVNGAVMQRGAEYWCGDRIVVPLIVTECRGRYTRLRLCTEPRPSEIRRESPTIEGRAIAVERIVFVPGGDPDDPALVSGGAP